MCKCYGLPLEFTLYPLTNQPCVYSMVLSYVRRRISYVVMILPLLLPCCYCCCVVCSGNGVSRAQAVVDLTNDQPVSTATAYDR